MMEPIAEPIRRRGEKEHQSPNHLTSKQHDPPLESLNKNESKIQTSFRNNMLIGVAVPFSILLVFGGRLSVLIVCFGGLVCYIFDLLGSLEITFMVLLMTLMGLLGSLIYAARVFLSEFSLNFSLVIIMGVILFQLVTVMSSYFYSILNEFEVLFEVLDPLVFATLPLVSSSLVSWFLCVEVPALDLESCFAVVYFLYVVTLLGPRYKSRPVIQRHPVTNVPMVTSTSSVLVVPLYVMKLVYALPVFMCPLVHCALHHNVLSSNKSRIIGIALSVLFPSLLMLLAARRQLHYWEAGSRDSVKTHLTRSLSVVAGLLLICWQDHPVLDELKSFSGLDEPWPSYLLLGTMLLLCVGFSMYQYTVSFKREADDLDAISATSHQRARSGQTLSALESLVSLCIGCSTALVSVLVSIPAKVLPVSMIGSMALAEYYHRGSWTPANKVLLVVIAAISLAIVASAFTHNTVYYMVFGFAWHFDLSMQQFCALFATLLSFSVAVPALLTPFNSAKSSIESLGLPGSEARLSGAAGAVRVVLRRAFIFSAVVLTCLFSAAELMMREQDWNALEVTVETIYPTYYLLGTASLVVCAAVGLFAAGVIGPSSLWVLSVIQACKLLHLLGFPSKACLAVGAVLLTYTLPFIRHVSEFLTQSAQDNSVTAAGKKSATESFEVNGTVRDSTLPVLEVLSYALSATAATFWARSHIAYSAIRFVLNNDDPSDLQVNTASLAIWSLYMSCLLLVFYRKAKLARSLLLVLCVLSTLVATEGLGKLSFSVDPSSSLFLSVSLHPDLTVNEHTGLFIMLSGGLTFSALVGLIPLQSFASSLAYTTVFSFISAKAMLGWAFPLSLAEGALSHDLLAFPFLYLYVSKFINTYLALRHQDNSVLIDSLFVISCMIPFAAVTYVTLIAAYDAAIAGVVWATIVGTASLGLSVRCRDFMGDIKALSRSKSKSTNSHVTMLICVVCAVLGIFWTSVSVAVDPNLDRDLLVPLSVLLVLTTKRGTLMPDTHPVAIVAILCSTWWVLSAFHAMFVRGWREQVLVEGGAFQFHNHSLFGLDHNVSVWTSSYSPWMHVIHIALLLLPLPGIVLSFLRRKEDSDQALFTLALISTISIIGGPIGSIKYLGLIGCIYAGWRCYDIGQIRKVSDRLI